MSVGRVIKTRRTILPPPVMLMARLLARLLLVVQCTALVPLADRSRARIAVRPQPPALSRRQAALLGSALALQLPLAAGAEAEVDSLVAALQDVRSQWGSADQLVRAAQWDEVRKLVQSTLSLLSLKGYRGASVKSRALDLDEGTPARKGLLEDRQSLLVALGALDRLAYEQQGGGLRRGPKTTFDPSEALADVKASSDALDAILKRL